MSQAHFETCISFCLLRQLRLQSWRKDCASMRSTSHAAPLAFTHQFGVTRPRKYTRICPRGAQTKKTKLRRVLLAAWNQSSNRCHMLRNNGSTKRTWSLRLRKSGSVSPPTDILPLQFNEVETINRYGARAAPPITFTISARAFKLTL